MDCRQGSGHLFYLRRAWPEISMIVLIEGTLVKATPLTAIISAGGIGYAVNVPVTTAEKLPQNGESVRLHTRAVYREDSQALYGFWEESERDFFTLVIEKVSGVGPKVAISLMSKLQLDSLISAIAAEDAHLLAKTPGIGKKTAERIIIELKDKLNEFRGFAQNLEKAPSAGVSTKTPAQSHRKSEDAILALQALGYKKSEAEKAIARAMEREGANLSTEALIKAALG